MKVIPFLYLFGPCVPCDAQWRDHQHFSDEEAVKAEVENSGEGDDALAKAHIEEHRCYGMCQNEVGGIRLVFIRTVFHRASLQSAPRRPGSTPKSRVIPTDSFALPAGDAVSSHAL